MRNLLLHPETNAIQCLLSIFVQKCVNTLITAKGFQPNERKIMRLVSGLSRYIQIQFLKSSKKEVVLAVRSGP